MLIFADYQRNVLIMSEHCYNFANEITDKLTNIF